MDVDTPGPPLSDLFRRHPETAAVFIDFGFLCVGCPAAPFHTITDACREYRTDEAVFRAEIAAVIAAADRRRPR